MNVSDMAGKNSKGMRVKADYSEEELIHLTALGRAVAALRESETGLSRSQFAIDADVHRNSMNTLENGQSSAGFALLLRVADTLGVTMSGLMEAYEEELERYLEDYRPEA